MTEGAALLQLLIIDASPLRRACMGAALDAGQLRVVSLADLDGHDPRDRPDIVLFQTGESMAEATSLPVQIAHAAEQWPGIPVLVIADHGDERLMLAAVSAGAQGVLPSTISVRRIHQTLNLIEAGLAIYPASLTRLIRKRLQSQGVPHDEEMRERVRIAVDRIAPLTRRQRDVLRLLALGASNKDIANSLQISESTVKVHVRAIMALKGASNRTQIVAHLLKGDPAHDQPLT